MIDKSTKRPRNKYLRQLYDNLTGTGWVVTSRGAPDFFCWKKDEKGNLYFICVEAVRKSTYRLRKHQKAVIETFARLGVQCYRYNCDSGVYEKISYETPKN
jgi:hypothetical protein